MSRRQSLLNDGAYTNERLDGSRLSLQQPVTTLCSSSRPSTTPALPAYTRPISEHSLRPAQTVPYNFETAKNIAGMSYSGPPVSDCAMTAVSYNEFHRISDQAVYTRPHTSLHMSPYGAVINPNMMMRHHSMYPQHLPGQENLSFYESPVTISSTTSTPAQIASTFYASSIDNSYEPASAVWKQDYVPIQASDPRFTSMGDGVDIASDDEESQYDKPYAQLIYEALYHAPGHRMLLRDIYDWFVRNTNKPRESGTNGWQNSIRHNLSMNQAFENDKSDPASARGARKANSVWVLTEHARKHGVQSTTRYRKTGMAKRLPSNKSPAIQRQRSGAKGGRAARRTAARMRKEKDDRKTKDISENGPALSFNIQSPTSTTYDEWSTYSESPVTPLEDIPLAQRSSLPHRSCYQYDEDIEHKLMFDMFLNEDEHLRQMLSASTTGTEYEDLP